MLQLGGVDANYVVSSLLLLRLGLHVGIVIQLAVLVDSERLGVPQLVHLFIRLLLRLLVSPHLSLGVSPSTLVLAVLSDDVVLPIANSYIPVET